MKVTTKSVPVKSIHVPKRLRAIDPAWAEALAQSIAESGLQQPVEVREVGGKLVLVAGAHRIEAHRLLGLDEIETRTVAVDDLQARLREIDENLFRHELTALDRAVFLAERKTVYEALHPETRKGAQGGRGGKRNETGTMPFSKDAAAKTGLDATTIRRAVRIAGGIPADVRQRLAGTRFADKQGELLALAKQPPKSQGRIVELLLKAKNPAPSVRAAVAVVEGRAVERDPDEEQLTALLNAWRRAGAKARRRFLKFVEEEGTGGKRAA